jgi:hypothetical protein
MGKRGGEVSSTYEFTLNEKAYVDNEMNLCSIQSAISTGTERLGMASKIGRKAGAAVVDSNFTRASYRVILRFRFYLLDCERLQLQILYRLIKSDNFTFANLKIVPLGPQLRNI